MRLGGGDLACPRVHQLPKTLMTELAEVRLLALLVAEPPCALITLVIFGLSRFHLGAPRLLERYHIEIRGEAFNLFNNTLVQAVQKNAYNYGTPTASTAAAPNPSCWNGVTSSGPGPAAGTMAHVNTCMVPVSNFRQPTTTTGNLLGARQLQAGIRFEF